MLNNFHDDVEKAPKNRGFFFDSLEKCHLVDGISSKDKPFF